MTYKQVCNVNNNQVIITLPADFKGKKQVTVVVDDLVDARIQKLAMLKNASKDPLFLADIAEIQQDFDNIDNETL